MRQYTQTLAEIQSVLSEVSSDWKDDHAVEVIELLDRIEPDVGLKVEHYFESLHISFDATITVIRLLLELSKDEFGIRFKAYDRLNKNPNKTHFTQNYAIFMDTLKSMGLFEIPADHFTRSFNWKDLILDRLKTGRGSAIRGQARGRALEDWVQEAIVDVFGSNSFERNISFVGKNLTDHAKCDFAIPNRERAKIVIEAKAYGATGSKQTDVIGDIEKIVSAKRHDTYFLLVTDGITWNLRVNDLRKIVDYQNAGYIYRVYTRMMQNELLDDLTSFKKSLFDSK